MLKLLGIGMILLMAGALLTGNMDTLIVTIEDSFRAVWEYINDLIGQGTDTITLHS